MPPFDGLSRAGRPDDETPPHRVNPVVHAIQAARVRTRSSLPDEVVEPRARAMQAAASFDRWDDLDEVDQQLWMHMARLELAQRAGSR